MFFNPQYRWIELTVVESVSSEALILNLLVNKEGPAIAGKRQTNHALFS
jgi:hypothetical protein